MIGPETTPQRVELTGLGESIWDGLRWWEKGVVVAIVAVPPVVRGGIFVVRHPVRTMQGAWYLARMGVALLEDLSRDTVRGEPR